MDPRDIDEKQPTVKSERPWGNIHMVVRNQACSVDLTHVRPGETSSLHSHTERTELFHFIDNGAVLEVNGQRYRPAAHEEYVMRPGDIHRFWAEDTEFRMLVVSFGEWKAADQTRHEDQYGRAGKDVQL
jgi:mannose-6-phosphate isomerase-like protein (cupin superfamily)